MTQKPWYYIRPFQTDVENIEGWLEQLSEELHQLHLEVRRFARLRGYPSHHHVLKRELRYEPMIGFLLRPPDTIRDRRVQIREWMGFLSGQVEDVRMRIEHIHRHTDPRTATTPGGGSTNDSRPQDGSGRQEMFFNAARDLRQTR